MPKITPATPCHHRNAEPAPDSRHRHSSRHTRPKPLAANTFRPPCSASIPHRRNPRALCFAKHARADDSRALCYAKYRQIRRPRAPCCPNIASPTGKFCPKTRNTPRADHSRARVTQNIVRADCSRDLCYDKQRRAFYPTHPRFHHTPPLDSRSNPTRLIPIFAQAQCDTGFPACARTGYCLVCRAINVYTKQSGRVGSAHGPPDSRSVA